MSYQLGEHLCCSSDLSGGATHTLILVGSEFLVIMSIAYLGNAYVLRPPRDTSGYRLIVNVFSMSKKVNIFRVRVS